VWVVVGWVAGSGMVEGEVRGDHSRVCFKLPSGQVSQGWIGRQRCVMWY
jgi:hypothetical protein